MNLIRDSISLGVSCVTYLPKMAVKSYMTHVAWNAAFKYVEDGTKEAVVELAGGAARLGGAVYGGGKVFVEVMPDAYATYSHINGTVTHAVAVIAQNIPKMAFQAGADALSWAGQTRAFTRQLLG